MAGLCIAAAVKYYPKRVYLILVVIFVGYSTFYIPSIMTWMEQDDLTMLFDEGAKMQNLFVEESREFLGLMICIGVLVFYLVRTRKLGKA